MFNLVSEKGFSVIGWVTTPRGVMVSKTNIENFCLASLKNWWKPWWQASLSNWMHGSSKKEIGGKKNPGEQNLPVGSDSSKEKRISQTNYLLWYFFKGGWNSKKMLTHLGDGASHMSHLTLSLTSHCSRFSCLRSLQGNLFFPTGETGAWSCSPGCYRPNHRRDLG